MTHPIACLIALSARWRRSLRRRTVTRLIIGGQVWL